MRTTLALLFFLPFILPAQDWCPPGATWTYRSEMFTEGFMRMRYTGDTLVDGYVAQVIDRYSSTQYPQPGPPPTWSTPYVTYDAVAVITRSADDVVYQWSPLVEGWDTLYWFAALPGDHWRPAHIDDPTCGRLLVADTGSTVFDGMPLRWVEIDGLRVYERIGPAFDMYLACPRWVVDGPAGIRCYSDDQISVSFVDGTCELVMDLEERAGGSVPIHPCPGNTHFTLQLPPGEHHIGVFDATGRQVLQELRQGGVVEVDVTALSPGMHLIRVDHVPLGAWIKQ